MEMFIPSWDSYALTMTRAGQRSSDQTIEIETKLKDGLLPAMSQKGMLSKQKIAMWGYPVLQLLLGFGIGVMVLGFGFLDVRLLWRKCLRGCGVAGSPKF